MKDMTRKESKVEKNRLRIDFVLEEVEEIGTKDGAKKFRFKAIPDPRVWERIDKKGEHGYFNKLDEIFIPDDVMKRAIRGLTGILITAPSSIFLDKSEYIEKSRERVKKLSQGDST